MFRIIAGLMIYLAVVAAARAGSTEQDRDIHTIPQIFLIQNSGWMEPFITDPNAGFVTRIARFINVVAGPVTTSDGKAVPAARRIVIATFNVNGQDRSGRPSPAILYDSGYDVGGIQEALTRIDAPRKSSGRYVDSHYDEALLRAITENNLLGQTPGVIWMVTNNRNATTNRPEAVKVATLAFGRFLRREQQIVRVLAFTLPLSASGREYEETRNSDFLGKGLVLYGMSYSQDADKLLAEIGRRGRIPSADREQGYLGVFSNPPLRLKPLEVDPIALDQLKSLSDDIEALVPAPNFILLRVPRLNGGNARLGGSLSATFINAYYPHVIEKGRIAASLQWDGATTGYEVPAVPNEVGRLEPSEQTAAVTLTLDLPLPGSDEDSSDDAVEGTLQLNLQMTLSKSTRFTADTEIIANLEALPDIFDSDKGVDATTPIRIRVEFYDKPPYLLLLGLSGGTLMSAAAFWYLARKQRHPIMVGTERAYVNVRPFGSETVRVLGREVRVRGGRLIGPPKVEFNPTGSDSLHNERDRDGWN